MKSRIRRPASGCGFSKTSLLELVEPLLELLDLRPVVVDHRVDDPVHQHAGAFAEEPIALRAQTSVILLDRSRLARVDGDQILRAEEEIDVLRLEAVLRRGEVDAVEDQVEIVAVGLDLGCAPR